MSKCLHINQCKICMIGCGQYQHYYHLSYNIPKITHLVLQLQKKEGNYK